MEQASIFETRHGTAKEGEKWQEVRNGQMSLANVIADLF
jgi:hypothetical protein